jgi:glycosyltransferase involved in cell wall biosynthesis
LPEARLLIVGDGPERTRLECLANDLGIEAAVDFNGHLDSMAMEDALASAWVQAVPSLWEEPFGLVAAESMMRGTAVVASNAGGLTEQVIDGKTGYLVPPGNANSLARALERILTDREHAELLGQRGHQEAMSHFTMKHYVDRVLEIFETLRKNEVK